MRHVQYSPSLRAPTVSSTRSTDLELLAPRRRPARSRRESFTLRPVYADGIVPVPVQRGLAHLIKDAHADGRRLRHLNDRAGVPFIEKIKEGSARRLGSRTRPKPKARSSPIPPDP